MPTHRYGRWWCVGFCSLLILPKPTVTLDINQPTATKPNFILLMSDDMGVGDVSYNNVSSRINMPGAGGEEYIVNPPRTPNIDAMASSQNSIIFNRFYAGSGVCSPTRSAVLTGRTPDRECIFNAEGCGQVCMNTHRTHTCMFMSHLKHKKNKFVDFFIGEHRGLFVL